MEAGKNNKTGNIANCIPQALMKHEVDDQGVVKILIPRFRSRWTQWLQQRLKRPYIRLRLDELGSAVWVLIDGKRTTLEIGKELERKFGDKIQPVRERLGLFMGLLKKNKFVSWDSDEESGSEPIQPK